MPEGISFFLHWLGMTNFVRATSLFNLARAQKSNSIPLYYNTSHTSSQEKFQISFPNICAHRTYVLSNFYFCQIFVVFSARARAVKFFHLSNFQISCKRATNELRKSCAQELQILKELQILRRPRSFIKK